MGEFLLGVRAALGGLSHAARSPEVRRAYLKLVLAIFALAAALDATGLTALVHFTPGAQTSEGWASLGWWVVRVVVALVILLAAPVLAVLLSNLAFPVFADLPFFAGMTAHDAARSAELQALPGLGWPRALRINLVRLTRFLVLSASCFVLGWVPLIGIWLAPPLSFYLAARTLGWELLDPYLSRLSLDLGEQRVVLGRHRAAVLGFGVVSAALLAIPFVGPLFFGLLQAAAARLVLDVLERDPKKASHHRTSQLP